MTDHRYAVIVIGAGSGGLTVAVGLAGLGKRVALVEVAEVGGDCTNVGCIPSKTLIHLSRTAGTNTFDLVRARRDHLRDQETHEVQHTENLTFVAGRARILGVGLSGGLGGGRVLVEGDDGTTQTLEAKHIVISTGSRPRPIPIHGLEAHRLLTNENLWDLTTRPDHLAVVGAGPIGLEMAAAFRRLGGRVTLVELAPRLLPDGDGTISEVLTASLRSQGIDLHLAHTVGHYDEPTRTLSLSPAAGEDSPMTHISKVDRVLVAAGRLPRIDGLGLAELEIDLSGHGIDTDSWGRTSVDGIWAVGDVTGRTATTHGANVMGRRIVQAIGLPAVPRIGKMPAVPMVIFTEPEVATVGMSLAEIKMGWPPDAVMRLQVNLADTDRGYTDYVEHGAVVVYAERLTGRVLRATIAGPAAAEAIGIFTLAIDRGVSLHRLYRQVHPYPTHAGAIGKVADEFMAQTLPNLAHESAAWLRSRPARMRSRLSGD